MLDSGLNADYCADSNGGECDLSRRCAGRDECVVRVRLPGNAVYRLFVYGVSETQHPGDVVTVQYKPPSQCAMDVCEQTFDDKTGLSTGTECVQR